MSVTLLQYQASYLSNKTMTQRNQNVLFVQVYHLHFKL